MSFIRPATDEAIATAVSRLRAGELVGFPTETVYGLGADASNVHAVARLFTLKGRPANHPVIVHLARPAHIDEWALDIPADARRLLDAFAPGPLTLILKKSARVPDVVTGGQDTVGIRFPSHPVAQRLLEAFGGGVAAPSANRFGRVSPTTARHVTDEFGDALPLVIDGGPCEVGIESTIVDVSQGAAVLLRPGGVSLTRLSEALGYVPRSRATDSPRVSGDLASHYAPRTMTSLVDPSAIADIARAAAASGRTTGVLAHSFAAPDDFSGVWRQAPHEAQGYARALYAELRLLDASGVDRILVEAPPAGVEWQAIGDRLQRATHGAQ